MPTEYEYGTTTYGAHEMRHSETGSTTAAAAVAQPVSGFYVALPPVEEASGILVADIVGCLRKNIRWLIVGAVIGFVIGLCAFLTMRPVYRAEVLAAPASADKEGGLMSALNSQLGGLAQLGGISLPGRGDSAAEVVAVIRSRKFVSDFISEKRLMPVIFAEKWDAGHNRWKSGDVSKQPTQQQAYAEFSRRIMNVDLDESTRFVTVTIDWRDPIAATEWANAIIARVNTTMRQRALVEAQQNIDYLNRELSRTELVGLKQGVSTLIEAEVRRAMLANTRVEFSLRVIDPAVAPDKGHYIRPSWPLLIIGGMLIGLILTAGLVVLLSRDLGGASLLSRDPRIANDDGRHD
jgi:uncharacterized protein involved in exopolysaccharide biosynthesis